MHFEQLYLDCLAQASYLLAAANGDAVVVDPRRDVDVYVDRAETLGLTIRHVVCTHVHADFVSGVTELTARGATLWMGEAFDGELDCERLVDGATLSLGDGDVTLTALATPGHTPESICLLVTDEADATTPRKLLTGDTLFCGDVGRPDLVGARGLTAEAMAAMLYRSLRAKIVPLDDAVEVWPGHGAGSACGKNLSSDTSSTIGQQRLQNWALRDQSEAEFVRALTTGLRPPPAYFQHAAALNRAGPRAAADLEPLVTLDAGAVRARRDDGAIALDVRSAAEFGTGHVPGALNVGLRGSFASWCGALIPAETPIVLVARDRDDADEARMRLARVGLERVVGWIAADALDADEVLPQLSVTELADRRTDPRLQVVDVRGPGEYATARVPGGRSVPLDALPGSAAALADELDPSRPTAVVCGSGYRSSAASRYLRAVGFTDLYNVAGGTNAWLAAGLDVDRGEPSS